MHNSIKNRSILLLPLVVSFMGKQHKIEVVGKLFPFCKYFTCRIPGADMLVIEAVHHKAKGYSWETDHTHQFNYLVPFIGKEIEKHIK